MLYRSATVYGRGQTVKDEAEKQAIMTHVFEFLVGKSRTAAFPDAPRGLPRRHDGGGRAD